MGLGGRRKHTLQDNPILQARVLTLEGGSSTLGVSYTFGEVRPGLGRRRSLRVSTLKDDFVITKVLKPRTYKLANSQDEVYSNAWNIQQLRRFYP